MNDWFDPFREIVRFAEPMSRHTSIQVGGPAEFFFAPRSLAETLAVLRCCYAHGVPVRVLGGGFNLIVRDEGIQGAVVAMPQRTRLEVLSRPAPPVLSRPAAPVGGAVVRAEAGCPLSHLAHATIERGLAGCELLVGIPAQIGGAVCMNAGGRSGDIGVLVSQLHVLETDGRDRWIDRRDLRFEYRSANLDGRIVLEAEFELGRDDPGALRDRSWRILVEKERTQPMRSLNAGCIFRNPPGHSAGRLIETAGLKGRKCGGAMVSEVHANFIINRGECRASHILTLAEEIQAKVMDECHVPLQLEVQVW